MACRVQPIWKFRDFNPCLWLYVDNTVQLCSHENDRFLLSRIHTYTRSNILSIRRVMQCFGKLISKFQRFGVPWYRKSVIFFQNFRLSVHLWTPLATKPCVGFCPSWRNPCPSESSQSFEILKNILQNLRVLFMKPPDIFKIFSKTDPNFFFKFHVRVEQNTLKNATYVRFLRLTLKILQFSNLQFFRRLPTTTKLKLEIFYFK